MGPTAFEEEERVVGLTYNPHGVLFDVDTCGLCDPTENIYMDAMHTTVGFGSSAQFELMHLSRRWTGMVYLQRILTRLFPW